VLILKLLLLSGCRIRGKQSHEKFGNATCSLNTRSYLQVNHALTEKYLAINFNNILQEAFLLTFVLQKAACQMLVNLTTGKKSWMRLRKLGRSKICEKMKLKSQQNNIFYRVHDCQHRISQGGSIKLENS